MTTTPGGRTRIGCRLEALQQLQQWFAHLITQSEDDGALPTLYAVLADIPGNSYEGPSGFMESRGAPKLVGRSKQASDDELARRLGTASEQLADVTFPFTRNSR